MQHDYQTLHAFSNRARVPGAQASTGAVNVGDDHDKPDGGWHPMNGAGNPKVRIPVFGLGQ
jgi:hypothetical protein